MPPRPGRSRQRLPRRPLRSLWRNALQLLLKQRLLHLHAAQLVFQRSLQLAQLRLLSLHGHEAPQARQRGRKLARKLSPATEQTRCGCAGGARTSNSRASSGAPGAGGPDALALPAKRVARREQQHGTSHRGNNTPCPAGALMRHSVISKKSLKAKAAAHANAVVPQHELQPLGRAAWIGRARYDERRRRTARSFVTPLRFCDVCILYACCVVVPSLVGPLPLGLSPCPFRHAPVRIFLSSAVRRCLFAGARAAVRGL